MNTATATGATTTEIPRRPRLVIIHGDAPHDSTPASSAQTDPGIQQELPLRWPLDRHGEAAASALASYPPLPLLAGIPRPEPFVAHVATLVADIVAGARPASQLARYAILDVQQELARRCALRRAERPWGGAAARVTSTSTMVVSDTAVQVVVVFLAGPRAHGAAVRMEYRHRRWLVTDVQTPA